MIDWSSFLNHLRRGRTGKKGNPFFLGTLLSLRQQESITTKNHDPHSPANVMCRCGATNFPNNQKERSTNDSRLREDPKAAPDDLDCFRVA
ncbi:hypothetical protein M514_12129 [Trichuris suis]|uniref:Uncharacterized protein n=1 Tax=Trichuris suis TaxID=68888 RepID=A0A085LPV3_9BILA|nr:hypothetical protein M513_12129 [Trichuris suis]KFD61869.1 hypothetical protein M514_12129 [Trichuris suis]